MPPASMVAFNIFREKITKDLKVALLKMYKKPSVSNKVLLIKKLFNLKMADSESVAGNFKEFDMLTSQLESVEINFEYEIRALVLLSSLLQAA